VKEGVTKDESDDNEDDELACLRKEMKQTETESQEADKTNQEA